MNVRPLVFGVVAALSLNGCDRSHDAGGAPPLQGAAIGGPFALIDQDGRRTTERRFAGRWRVFYFGYTYCPDVCPTTLQKLMAGYHQFAQSNPAAAARLVPVFVTVDPRRDTPAILKDYVAAFGPGLVGLTGSADAIAQVARRYGVYYKAQPPAPGGTGYLVDHSSQAILFDPSGKPIVIVPTDQDGADAVKAVAATFAQWVK